MESTILGAFFVAIFVTVLVQIGVFSYRRIFKSKYTENDRRNNEVPAVNRGCSKKIRRSVCEVDLTYDGNKGGAAQNTKSGLESKSSNLPASNVKVNKCDRWQGTLTPGSWQRIAVLNEGENQTCSEQDQVNVQEHVPRYQETGNVKTTPGETTTEATSREIAYSSTESELDWEVEVKDPTSVCSDKSSVASPLTDTPRKYKNLKSLRTRNKEKRSLGATLCQPDNAGTNGTEGSEEDIEEIPEVLEGTEEDSNEGGSDKELVPCFGGFMVTTSDSEISYEDDWEPADDSETESQILPKQ